MHPDFDFIATFVSGVGSTETIIGVIGFIAAACFAGIWATKIGSLLLPKPKESRVADFLPFEKLLSDGVTIKCHDGSLVRCFSVKGADMSLLPPEQRDSLLEVRKSFIDSLGDLQLNCRVITLRERVPVQDERADFENPLLQRISDTWDANLNRIYQNKHYIILSVKDRENSEQDLNQGAQSLLAVMDEYEIKTLFETPDSLATDSPFSPFISICNPITRPSPKVGKSEGEDLKSLLTSEHIHFTGEKGIIKFFSGDQEKLAITMGVRTSGDFIDEQMTADLLSIDAEINLVHNVSPFYRPKARALLMQQRKMAMVTSFSPSVIEQYDEALALIEDSDADYQSLVQYAMSIVVYGDDADELEFAESEIQRICRLYSVTPVREGWVSQATFFSQFPTYDVYPRTYMYLSRAVACSVCLDKPSEGLRKSDWGDGAIAIFRTTQGSAYRWQFHVTDGDSGVAHCCTIGPTGQGKTTLLAFLAGQAMRHKDLRTYFFDRHRGVEIFTKAIGGSYITFDGDEKSASLNPFDCRNTPENKAFLRRWLKAITLADDAISEKEIARAVTTSFEYLKDEEKVLKNLHKSCFSPTGNMRRELFRWVNPDQYGNIFNATKDSLDLSAKKFMSFDFTSIFEDETLAPAVISYIMHRIQTETGSTGTPSLIMIDETAPMLKHPMFRDHFITGLQEGRKKRQAYVCAFQQPNIVDTLGVGEVIRGQCQTVIFFRNPQAKFEDYENWNLTPSELAFIFGKTFREFPYAILVSRPAIGESVILDVDLGGLGPYLKLYSSGRKNVLLAEELQKEYGVDNFAEKYLELS